jgi:tyrosyl-tRNA synthetase
LLPQDEVEKLAAEHREKPHLRLLQKKLAEEITTMVHSRDDYEMAVEASQILFGKGTAEQLRKLNESTFLSVFEGVPQFSVSKNEIEEGVNVIELLSEKTAVFPSKGELRRTIKGNGLSINKEKVGDAELIISSNYLIGGKYILAQKGKKNYFLIIAE